MVSIDGPTDNDVETVDPSWFVSPVERIDTSGGTAPFFKLTLTDKGMEELASMFPKFKGVKCNPILLPSVYNIGAVDGCDH